jgi:hypothetical protein
MEMVIDHRAKAGDHPHQASPQEQILLNARTKLPIMRFLQRVIILATLLYSMHRVAASRELCCAQSQESFHNNTRIVEIASV